MFTAAFVTNTTLRDYLISSVRKHAANGTNTAPLSDWYDATTALDQGFKARPVVGAHLALVSLASWREGLQWMCSDGLFSGIAK